MGVQQTHRAVAGGGMWPPEVARNRGIGREITGAGAGGIADHGPPDGEPCKQHCAPVQIKAAGGIIGHLGQKVLLPGRALGRGRAVAGAVAVAITS